MSEQQEQPGAPVYEVHRSYLRYINDHWVQLNGNEPHEIGDVVVSETNIN